MIYIKQYDYCAHSIRHTSPFSYSADCYKLSMTSCFPAFGYYIRAGARGVNLAGKVKKLFLVTIDVYRLKNRRIGSLPGSRVVGGPMLVWGPPRASSFINSS